jgi:ABC-type uncharacterized transport system permease subunit
MTVPSVAVEDDAVESAAGGHPEREVAHRRNLAWLGLLPFFAYLAIFLVWPTITVFTQALQGENGATTSALTEAITGQYQEAFIASLRLSFVTALLGALIGVLLAYAAATLRRPKWRSAGLPPTSAASRWRSRSSPHLAPKG